MGSNHKQLTPEQQKQLSSLMVSLTEISLRIKRLLLCKRPTTEDALFLSHKLYEKTKNIMRQLEDKT